MLFHQEILEFDRIESVHTHVCYSARLLLIEISKNSYSPVLSKPMNPAVPPVAQSGSLPLRAYGLVERQGFQNGDLNGKRMTSNLFKLADIVVHGRGGPHKGPHARDLLFLDIQETRS